MARQIISYAPEHDLRRQLIACDPAGLKTSSVPIQKNQGRLEPGCFVDVNWSRALIAREVEGVLATWLDTDDVPLTTPYTEANGQIAIYTAGRFLWPAVRKANPGFVFDEVSISTLRAKGITLEPVFAGGGERWIREP